MLLRFTKFVVCLLWCLEVKKAARQRLECLVPCHESGQNCKLCVSLKISWQSDWQPDSRNESRNLSPGFVSVSVSAWSPQVAHPKLLYFFPHKNSIFSGYCRCWRRKVRDEEWRMRLWMTLPDLMTWACLALAVSSSEGNINAMPWLFQRIW